MARELGVQQPHVVGADLVPQAREPVDEHGDLAALEPECLRDAGIEDFVDHLHLDEVIPGAHRAQLSTAARSRSETAAGSAPSSLPSDSVRSTSSARTREGPQGRDGGFRRAPVAPSSRPPLLPTPAGTDLEISCTSAPRRSRALLGQRQGEQPHAAVDVVADATGETTPSGSSVAATPPTGKP